MHANAKQDGEKNDHDISYFSSSALEESPAFAIWHSLNFLLSNLNMTLNDRIFPALLFAVAQMVTNIFSSDSFLDCLREHV